MIKHLAILDENCWPWAFSTRSFLFWRAGFITSSGCTAVRWFDEPVQRLLWEDKEPKRFQESPSTLSLKHEMSGVEMYWLGRLCLMMLWSLWNNISKTASKYTFNILQILWCINFISTNFIPYELYIHLPFQRQGVEFGRSSNLALRHRASTLRFVGRSSAIRRHITWASRWVGLVFGSP